MRCRWSSLSSPGTFIRAAVGLCAGLTLATSLQASELQVYPLRLELQPKAPTALLTVGNRGADDTIIQIAVFSWRQVDGQDKLDPTRDVLVNPPVFPLKAGAQQIARFGLRVQPGDVERSYRFMLQEVPRQQQPGFTGLNTLLKMSIPIFVPPIVPKVELGWRVSATRAGASLTISNSGNVHVQLRSLKLSVGSTVSFDKPVNVYVLPGATRTIPLELDHPIAPGATAQLQVDTDQSPVSIAIKAEAAVDGPISR